MVKTKPRFGTIFTLNMPKKSHQTEPVKTRPARSVVKDVAPEQNAKYYKSFKDLVSRLKALKSLKDWTLEEMNDEKRKTVILQIKMTRKYFSLNQKHSKQFFKGSWGNFTD